MSKTIIGQFPWHKDPTDQVDRQNPLNSEWGFLVFYNDGTFEYIDKSPTDEEIINSSVYQTLISDTAIDQ